jgi:hypothetical protein
MGTFSVFGYDDNNAQRFRKMWQLKPGDIYDASYIREFAKKAIPVPAGTNLSGANPPRSKIASVPHRDTLVVDVTLSLSASAN